MRPLKTRGKQLLVCGEKSFNSWFDHCNTALSWCPSFVWHINIFLASPSVSLPPRDSCYNHPLAFPHTLHSQNTQSGESAGKHGRLTTLWAPSRVLSAFPHTCPGDKANTRRQQTAVLGGVFDERQDCCSLCLSQITPTVKSWQSIQLLLGHKHGSTQIFIWSKTNVCPKCKHWTSLQRN